MDDEQFRLLLTTLKIMEWNDYKKLDLEATIINIIDSFEEYFNESQKQYTLKKFIHYERIRKNKFESEKRKAIIERIEYQQILDCFMKGETPL